ncbi:phosphotransferase [Vibrio diabolicus]|uniref:PHP domain-containing protein n=1 Tax=Vibrio diabolicus TaxID=50719 RepID=UPI00215FB72B|nr:PHP domain-containing protein [Vibrio diabolicus]MCS0337981.1 phosphotransferase [Vibrio diabolicus]
MKKIDLHLHTVSTISDADFTFSLSKLCEYISTAKLDAIAITNHDMFDLEQFYQIDSAVDCVVFPGIEINLDNGHVLLISENQDLEDFQLKTMEVTKRIRNIGDSISTSDLHEIFGDLNKYLIIPHYDKKPSLSKRSLSELSDYISVGEVDSPKKFIRLCKDDSELTPVLFSDVRIKEGLRTFPPRQTYIDCGEVTLKSIKSSLRDRTKVALSESDGNRLFQVFDDGLHLSTGLNIILGMRSSGKTVTLNRIHQECENVKYIPQFSLVQRDDASYDREFNQGLAREKSNFSDKYLSAFKGVLDDVIDIDIEQNRRKVSDYLDSLMKLADDAGKRDAFSKSSLFNESLFDITDDKGLSDLINSTRLLIDNTEYRAVIDKHVNLNGLKALICELIKIFRSKSLDRKKKGVVNDIVRDVKNKLQLRSSSTQIKDVDLYKVISEHQKVKRFNEITKLLQEGKVIQKEYVQNFTVICKQRPFNGAGEVKNVSGVKTAFKDAFDQYLSPYNYLVELRNNEALTPSELYKYFTCIEYEILNKDGFAVSGGERSEFRLLQEIKDAQNFDYLLIDEPESSFDNLFLKGEVNQILKDLSKTMPVVVVTHNNTVGASIKPDYIVYTSKEIEDGKIIYRRYSGHPSNVHLSSVDGKSIDNFDITMNSLEAGENSYNERRGGYASIKN